VRHRRLVIGIGISFLLALVCAWRIRSANAQDQGTLIPAGRLPLGLNCDKEPCDAVARGFRTFFDRKLNGLAANGRSCADCHMASDQFQLSPASVESRYQLLQWRRRSNPNADDPLFRPIDADDFRVNGENASDFRNLRENGLVRILIPLPANMKLIDPATNLPSVETVAEVWRAVPSVNDAKLTGPDGLNPWPRGPNASGGYQLDGRKSSLQEQALGALTDHAQVQSPPTQQMLEDLASFQSVLFTNERVKALADAIQAGTSPLPNPDPPLNSLEQQGKVVFERACAQCHGGPGQSTGQRPVVRYHDISSQCPRPVDTVTPARFAYAPCPARLARNARTYEITQPNGAPPHEFRPRPRAINRLRRWCSCARRLEQARHARTPWDKQDGTIFPQQQRGHTGRSG